MNFSIIVVFKVFKMILVMTDELQRSGQMNLIFFQKRQNLYGWSIQGMAEINICAFNPEIFFIG